MAAVSLHLERNQIQYRLRKRSRLCLEDAAGNRRGRDRRGHARSRPDLSLTTFGNAGGPIGSQGVSSRAVSCQQQHLAGGDRPLFGGTEACGQSKNETDRKNAGRAECRTSESIVSERSRALSPGPIAR